MTVEQIQAVAAGAVAIIGALTLLIVQVEKLRHQVNGRMEELLREARAAAHKDGELAGRDHEKAVRPQRGRTARTTAPERPESKA